MFLYYFFLISWHDDVKCWFSFISLADALFLYFFLLLHVIFQIVFWYQMSILHDASMH